MGVFDNQKNDGNWVFAPKQGEPDVKFVVTGGIERVKTENSKLTYKDKNHNETGYYDLMGVDGEKKLFISAWKLYFALQECNPEVGETITISHPDRGIYTVVKST